MQLYHTLLKTWNLGRAKTPGFNDHKRVHISNIEPFMIVESRGFSRRPKSKFLTECGIYSILMCTLLLVGCTSSFSALRGNHDYAINDLRMEIADLKHALHGTEVEVKLLEERMESSETAAAPDESVDLKKKIALLEKNLDKLSGEIRSLTHFSTQTSAALSVYRQQIASIEGKLDEISKLRSTLSQLSKTPPRVAQVIQAETSSYLIKSGDSLEKIARRFQISVEQLKRENNLSSDKIVVGQELAIPSK